MKITVVGRQMNVFETTKALVAEKLSKLDRFFWTEPEATVTLSRKHDVSTLEITINASGTLFRSEVQSDNFRDALDESIDIIERQIRKNKTRLEKRIRADAFEYPVVQEFDETEDQPEFIIRTKEFEFNPMSPEEAIMQMNLLGHNFFVFNDQEGDDTCVVYKRKDGAYGLIVPRH